MFYLIIVAVCLVFYARTYSYGCVIDDRDIEKSSKEKKLTGWHWWWGYFNGTYYGDMLVAHVLTTLVHTINCLLVYVLAGKGTVGLLAAILFAIHPSNTQGAVWLSGKHYAYATTIMLLALILHPFLVPIFYFVGLIWGGVGVIFLPFFVILYKNIWIGLLMIAIVTLGFKFDKGVIASIISRKKVSNKRMRTLTPRKVVLAVKTFSYYFCYSLLPWRIGMFHEFGYSYGITKQDSDLVEKMDFHFWGGLILCLLYVLLLCVNITNMIGFGLAFYLIMLFPFLNWVTIQQFVADRYVYLPNVGFCIALAHMLTRG